MRRSDQPNHIFIIKFVKNVNQVFIFFTNLMTKIYGTVYGGDDHRIRRFFKSSVYGTVYGTTNTPYTAPYMDLRILNSVYGAVYGNFSPYMELRIRSENMAPYTDFLTPYTAPYTELKIRRLRIRRCFRRLMSICLIRLHK